MRTPPHTNPPDIRADYVFSRTKLERADDLGLPPRTIVVRRDYFSPEEKELYMSLFSGAKRQFATYIDQGTVLNSQLLPPLRVVQYS